MSRFELLPAIDLIGGRVVRLRRGDFDQETSYGDDPVAVARAFADAGRALAARRGPRRRAGGGASPAGPGRRDRRRGLRPDAGRDRRRTPDRRGDRGCPGHRGRQGRDRHRRCSAIRPSPRRSSPATAPTGSSRPSTSGTASRSARAGARALPGVPAADAIARLAAAGIETFEVTAIERDGLLEGPGPRPAAARWSALGARPDHRVGRRLVDRRRDRRPGGGLRRRHRRPGALRGPRRPARADRRARRRRPP